MNGTPRAAGKQTQASFGNHSPQILGRILVQTKTKDRNYLS